MLDCEALKGSNKHALTKFDRETKYYTSNRIPNTASDCDATRHYHADEGISVAFLSLETRQRNVVRLW